MSLTCLVTLIARSLSKVGRSTRFRPRRLPDEVKKMTRKSIHIAARAPSSTCGCGACGRAFATASMWGADDDLVWSTWFHNRPASRGPAIGCEVCSARVPAPSRAPGRLTARSAARCVDLRWTAMRAVIRLRIRPGEGRALFRMIDIDEDFGAIWRDSPLGRGLSALRLTRRRMPTLRRRHRRRGAGMLAPGWRR